MMGWDDALMLLMAATSVGSALNPPENNVQTPGVPSSGMPNQGGMMNAGPLAPKAASAPSAPVEAINTDPLQSIASTLAQSGPPPGAALISQPTTGGRKEQMGPPSPSEDPVVQSKKNEEATKSIWAALPQAIAIAAPLLMNNSEQRQYAAPVAGGPGGANAFASPVRRPSLGEILNAIPRMR
jgi:hypothetical protein